MAERKANPNSRRKLQETGEIGSEIIFAGIMAPLHPLPTPARRDLTTSSLILTSGQKPSEDQLLVY